MGIYEKALITVLLVDGVFFAIAVPLACRWVPPNYVYGFRTRSTLSDENTWYAANAYFGVRFMAACLLSVLAFVGLYFSHTLSPRALLNTSLAALIVPMIIATVMTFRFISRGARQP